MTPHQARILAAYNRWINHRLYVVCEALSDAERKADRHAFFGSVHGTLNHLLLADRVWLGRFVDRPFRVAGLAQELHADFDALRADRESTDEEIIAWADSLSDEVLRETLRYTSITDAAPRTCPLWLAVTHFFNHQAHHRGQLTTLLSQCGQDYGVTDLIAMPGVLDTA